MLRTQKGTIVLTTTRMAVDMNKGSLLGVVSQ